MISLPTLPVVDLRRQLPKADWSIGPREKTTSITWHFNGPAVDAPRQAGDGLLHQLEADARYQMQPGWGGTKAGAPGLMYHFVIDALGVIYQTADEGAMLWHCAHSDGNSQGLAFHVPVGLLADGTPQPLTLPQKRSLLLLTEAKRGQYRIPLARTLGHLEWKHATLCPGEAVMDLLRHYRAGQTPTIYPTKIAPSIQRWRLRSDLTLPARIRQWPTTSAEITGRYKAGTPIYVDQVVEGDVVAGDRRWLQLAKVDHEQADLGYVSAVLAERLAT